MQYRQYGKDGPEVSVLGFGVMRLPQFKQGGVNFTRAVAVMHRAMEAGVNLFDSHHGYHGGNSEVAIGKALKGWKGQRIYIQTKTPFSRPEPQKHFKMLIEQALEKTGVNCIDYLLFHSLKLEAFKKRGKEFFRFTDWAIRHGYIRHRGFSSHDSPENVRKFIDSGEFKVMVVSYNWMYPLLAQTIAHAAGKGMGVAVMNPVGGGSLAAGTPQILRLIRGARSAPEVGLRFALATPGICCALSGMSAIEQVDENAAVASRQTYLTAGQRKAMQGRIKEIRRRGMLICASCGYCMPCPHGVDIPENLRLLIQTRLLGLKEHATRIFGRLRKRQIGDASALACKKCGQCLTKCPNNVAIIGRLAETAELLASSQPAR